MKKQFALPLFTLLIGFSSVFAAAGDADPNEYPGRLWPTAEEVLDGSWRAQFPPPFPAEVHDDVPGFAAERLTKVPEPGVHPRIIMSPADVTRLRNEYQKGEEAGFVFKGMLRLLKDRAKEDPHEYAPYAGKADWDWCPPLKAMALYALITEDDELGRKAAKMTVEHALYMEPFMDLANQDEQIRDYWYVFRGARPYVKEDGTIGQARASQTQMVALGFQYDYAYPWLTDAERAIVRRVISKMTYGKYVSQMEMPGQFNINNHMALASQFICLVAAIEGEEGYDPRIMPLMIQSLDEHLSYNISKAGVMFESVKGSTPSYSIITAARREPRLLRHDRLYRVVETAMRGATYLNNDYAVRDRFRPKLIQPEEDYAGQWQTFGGGSMGNVFMVKYFYPNDPAIDLVYKSELKKMNLDVMHRRPELSAEHLAMRAAGSADICLLFTTDGFTKGDGSIDWYGDNEIPEALQDKPKTWVDPDRGFVITRDKWAPDSMVVYTESRSDAYYGGHETGDFGEFSITHDGFPWVVEPAAYADPIFHNMMLVDGLGCGYPSAAGKLATVSDFDAGTTVVSDISEGYKWQLVHGGYDLSHPMYTQTDMFNFNKWLVWTLDRTTELPTQERIRAFYEGYAHKDYGSWHGENRGVVRYKKWNPMDYYFRTLHVARGEHPYVLIFDDAKKDDQPHPYEWGMMLHKDAKLVSINNAAKNRHEWLNAPASQIGTDMIFTMSKEERAPQAGDPMLLVRVLWRNSNVPFPTPNFQKLFIPSNYTAGGRVTVPAYAVDPEFRVLVYPHRQGEALPLTRWNEDRSRLFVTFDGQADEYDLTYTDGGINADQQDGRRVALAMTRNGEAVGNSNAQPPRPVVVGELPLASGAKRDPALLFEGAYEIRLKTPAAGQVVHYTLDGSEPTSESPVFSKSVAIDRSLTFKARTYADYWPFGEQNESPTTTVRFEQRAPAAALNVDPATTTAGLISTVHELRKDIYNEDGFFSGKKVMLPDLAQFTPTHVSSVEGLEIPATIPTLPTSRMAKGYYTYSGFITVPQTGIYRFKLNAPGPIDFEVGDQQVIEVPGPYNLSQKDFYGEASLAAGQHAFKLTVTDPVYWKGRMEEPLQIALHATCRSADGHTEPVMLNRAFHRLKDVEFQSPTTFAEQGTVRVHSDLKGELRYGLNAATLNLPVKDGIRLTTPGIYKVKVARFVDGEQSSPTYTQIVQVVPNAVAVKADVVNGLVKKIYDVHQLAPANRLVPGDGVNPEMFETHGINPFDTSISSSLDGDDVIIGMTEYTGYLKIQAAGTYEFRLDTEGANQFHIGDRLITENRVNRSDVAAELTPILYLEAGLHPISFRMVKSRGFVAMRPQGAGEFVPLTVASLYRPKQVEMTKGSTLMAKLDLGSVSGNEIAVKGQKGANAAFTDAKVVDSEHGPALSGTGKISITNLRTFHNGLTISMWVRPKPTTGRITFIESRIPTLSIRHWGNKIDGFLYPDGSSMTDIIFTQHGIEPGKWFHLTYSFGHANSVYVNGKRVGQAPIDWSVVRYSDGRLRNEDFTIDLRGGDVAGVRIYNEATTDLDLDPKYIEE